jgi:hypothetical protein
MKTVVTDVVRENNQTYRLGWSEQCKDGSRMGCGVPEYVLLFRRPPTDRSNGYADVPVVKSKPKTMTPDGDIVDYDYDGGKIVPDSGYSRARWQLDAHGFQRSSGNRLLTSEEMQRLTHAELYKRWREESLNEVYDFERHVALGELMESEKRLPSTFMQMPPHSWHPDVWTDITRMRTLNMLQQRKGQQQHLCLAAGSLVLTKADGYKPIETVNIGDEVLTHKGRWRKVLVCENTGVRECITVKAQGVPGLTLTPDHKLWTRRVRDLAWSKCHSKREAESVEPDWVESKDTVGSYVNFKLPEVEVSSNQNNHHWWIVGRWLADGHIGARGVSFTISCGYHNTDKLVAQLGVHAGTPHDVETGMQITLKDEDFSIRKILRRCGRGASEKHLPPEAYTLPVEQAKSLLDGYLSGDGHYIHDRQRFAASSVSRNLLLGISFLAQRAYGAIASVYAGREPGEATIQGRLVQTKQDWILGFDTPSLDRKKGLPFILKDGAWKKVRSADAAGEVETWNLRVDEDESYTAEGCIVKNCPLQFDIVNRLINQLSMPGEVIFDPFGGLMTVPYCAIRLGRFGLGVELNQGYFDDGVKYCEIAVQSRNAPTLFGKDDFDLDSQAEGLLGDDSESSQTDLALVGATDGAAEADDFSDL